MDKRSLKWITWCFVAVTVLIVVLVMMNTSYQHDHIVLPDTTSVQNQTADDPSGNGDILTMIEVRPDTVQAAIATLQRPEDYRRTVLIEQFWSGGSGSYEVTVTVSGPWTQVDRTMPDGRVRHSIVGEDAAYVWYNSERDVFSSAAGEITADNEQMIPTYEDILELPVESIVQADYRMLSESRCIYAEAVIGAYTFGYWVSVDSGLLVAAEKLLDGEVVYRMEAQSLEQVDTPLKLPDGTVLTTMTEDQKDGA